MDGYAVQFRYPGLSPDKVEATAALQASSGQENSTQQDDYTH